MNHLLITHLCFDDIYKNSSKASKTTKNISNTKSSNKNEESTVSGFSAVEDEPLIVDLSSVIAIRKKYQDQFVKKHNTKLGFMSFFVKASVNSLQSFPHLNAELHQDELIVKKYYDIGIAVATDEGLVVPVLIGADILSSAEIELGIAELATKSREKKITLQEQTLLAQ